MLLDANNLNAVGLNRRLYADHVPNALAEGGILNTSV